MATSVANAAQVEAHVQELLESAEALLKAASFAEAFDSLLEAWRSIRAPEIANLIEALSSRAARGKTVTGRTQTDRVVTWTKMFDERTPIGLGLLIADLDAVWSEDAQPRFIQPRIEALATVKDDPRVASALLRSLHDLGYGEAWVKLLVRCARGFEASGDPRIVTLLAAALKKKDFKPNIINPPWGEKTVTALRKKLKLPSEQTSAAVVAPSLPASLQPIAQSIHKLLAEIPDDVVIATPARAKPSGVDSAALLEQVRQAPDDEELRLILADALDAAGDPLGEFIVLQTRRAKGEGTAKTLSRERALLKAHMRTWLGAIAPAVKLKSAVFECGFLARCEAVVRRKVDAEIHFQHVEWATVRSITFEDEARITPAMRSLREAWNLDEHALKQLIEHGHPTLEKIGLGNRALNTQLTVQFAACSGETLPAFTFLELGGYIYRVNQADWVWEAPWAKRLKGFGVSSGETAHFLEIFRQRKHLDVLVFDRKTGFRLRVERGPASNPERFNIRGVFDDACTLPSITLAFGIVREIDPFELFIETGTGKLSLQQLDQLSTCMMALRNTRVSLPLPP